MTLKKLIKSPEYPNGILVDLTPAEIAQREQDSIQVEQEKQERLAKEKAHKEAKASALAKLQALGLNDAEIKSIIG